MITPEEMRDMAADLDRVAESLTHSGWVFAPKNCTRAAAMLRSIAAEREAKTTTDAKIIELGNLYAETGKDWDLTVNACLTEPVCPSACVQSEDGDGKHRYLAWGNTIDEAIADAVSQAHTELILKRPIEPRAPWFEKTDPSPLPKGAE